MKMKVLQVFIFAISISTITLADNICMIEIKTSDCEDCGMGTFGEIRMQVSIMINEFFEKQNYYKAIMRK